MKVSAFTFIKNGEILGYPFIQSINSVLPIVDEFVINIGESEDNTLALVESINNPKIRILKSQWNEKMQDRGYVYGQQKMIAHFNCSSDWAFYIESDEVYHERDLDKIRQSMEEYLYNPKVEALVFDYYHFYGNSSTYIDSPGWYRSEARIIKNSIRTYSPDGLFWLVIDKNRKGRYPLAKKVGVYCYHYGWVRSQDQMNLKSKKIQKYWGKNYKKIDYSKFDQSILVKFNGSHPNILENWLQKDDGLYKVDSNYVPNKREKKHRVLKKVENFFGIDLSKKHYKIIK